MGVIQNSANQTIGTVAGAIAMGKHISQQKESIAKQENANKLEVARQLENVTNKEIDFANQVAAYPNEELQSDLDAAWAKKELIQAEADKNAEGLANNIEQGEEYFKAYGEPSKAIQGRIDWRTGRAEKYNQDIRAQEKAMNILKYKQEARKIQASNIALQKELVMKNVEKAFKIKLGGNE